MEFGPGSLKEELRIEYKAQNDTSFVTGDSPVTIDVFDALGGRPGTQGYIINDGTGALTFALSYDDGSSYGDEIRLEPGEQFDFAGFKITQIRITWVADTAWRVYIQ